MNFKFLLTENTSELYPTVANPITNNDLIFLYDYYNKKIFNSKLPKARLKITKIAKNFYGKAHCKYEAGSYKINDLLITINSKIVTDPKLFIDTLIHEMIHVWQYKMNESTKSYKYSEATWSEVFASNDKHTFGHNKYFLDEMSRINKMGYNITVEGDAPIGTQLTDAVYGVLFYNNSESSILLWHPENPKEKMDIIIEDIADRKGDLFTSYMIFKTKESNITLATRLTKAFKLPKNVINITFQKKWADEIFKTASTVIVDNKIEQATKSDSKKIPDEIINMTTQTAKFRNVTFSSYLQTVWMNAYPEWRKISGRELNSKGNTFKGNAIPNDLSQESAEYIYDSWMKISDAEVKRAKSIGFFCTDYSYSVTMKKDLKNGIQNLENKYKEDFEDRVPLDKFKKFVKEKVFAEMKKKAKKYGREIDKKDFENTYNDKVRGSFLA